GVGGGYPLSLLLFHRRLDVWRPGDHIGTFRGQQIAMTAGRATIDFIVAAGLLPNATQMGTLLLERLRLLAAGHPAIAEVRGLGLMLGAEMAAWGGAGAGAVAARLQAALFAEGVVVEVGGRDGAVIRLLPPLTIGGEEVSLFLAAFERALAALCLPGCPASRRGSPATTCPCCSTRTGNRSGRGAADRTACCPPPPAVAQLTKFAAGRVTPPPGWSDCRPSPGHLASASSTARTRPHASASAASKRSARRLRWPCWWLVGCRTASAGASPLLR